MPDGKLFIGGEWETGTGEEIVSIFPADGSINCSLYGASKNDVLRAVKLAKSAQSQPSWRSLKPHERARYLYAIADGIEANIDRISQIQTRDTEHHAGNCNIYIRIFEYYYWGLSPQL